MSTGQALKWFPGAGRGLASGVVSAGYGAGAGLTLQPLARGLHEHGVVRCPLTFAAPRSFLALVRAPAHTLAAYRGL